MLPHLGRISITELTCVLDHECLNKTILWVDDTSFATEKEEDYEEELEDLGGLSVEIEEDMSWEIEPDVDKTEYLDYAVVETEERATEGIQFSQTV